MLFREIWTDGMGCTGLLSRGYHDGFVQHIHATSFLCPWHHHLYDCPRSFAKLHVPREAKHESMGVHLSCSTMYIIVWHGKMVPPAHRSFALAMPNLLLLCKHHGSKGKSMRFRWHADNRNSRTAIQSPQYRTDYTFKNLKNSTAYRITIQSKAVYNTSAQLSGESKIVGKTTTGRLSDSDVVVELEKSGNKVKVSWPAPAAGDEKYYHIYVGDNNSKNLELKAIIPASTAGYTNSGLTKGHTYYYYIVECKVVGVNHVPLRESKIKAITIN